MIPLPGAGRLPETLTLKGELYARKTELHVTVVGSRARLDAAAVREAGAGLDFEVQPTGRYRRVRSGARRALIELVTVPLLAEFYTRLERRLSLAAGTAPRLPSHVTLYTEPGGGGIGLYDERDIQTLSEEIADPVERQLLLAACTGTPSSPKHYNRLAPWMD